MATARRYRVKKDIKPVAEWVEPDLDRPQCPIHNREMKFSPLTLYWECKITTCNQIALPEVDAAMGKPILGAGDIMFITAEDDHGKTLYLMRCSENNVVIDVTDLVDSVGVTTRSPIKTVKMTFTQSVDMRGQV